MPLSKEAKKYTYTDYQEFPDDERWEIIDWRERILDRRTGHNVSVFTLQDNSRYGRPELYTEADSVEVSIFPDLTIELTTVFNL